MDITRWNSDFGNSMCQQLVDGNYFELPAAVCEVTEAEARSMFSEPIDKEKLLNNLLVRVDDRFYQVGAKAQGHALAHAHIDKLHDKSQSNTVLITWLSSIAYYHAYNVLSDKHANHEVNVGYFTTLLPVWVVKKADKFSTALNRMAERFIVPKEVELLTAGFERTLKLVTAESVCKIEGEISRFALKYDLDVKKRDEAVQFDHCYTVINDLGGQSQDLSRLSYGLGKAQSSDDFASSTDQCYLAVLEQLRVSKLMTHFGDVRELEAFILKNTTTRKYLFTDPVTKQQDDLTNTIEHTLRNFAKIAIEKATNAFHFRYGDEVKFVHSGGVNEALKFYMMEYLIEKFGPELAATAHVFPADARKLNLFGAEIAAKSELERRRVAEKEGIE
ncbi:Alp7A family actin-like protein [Paenibacillus sp. y28]|uniref:Alp7A family actin-like protein n=1 Tax=Paenibacillus sp. y28 TaxID=3129110 RepID=UPI00301A98E0